MQKSSVTANYCPECWRLYDARCAAEELCVHANQLALTHGSERLINSYRAAREAADKAEREFVAHKQGHKVTA
jgi:hypothetical protein